MPCRTVEKKLKRKISQQVKFIHFKITEILDLGGTPLQIAELDEPLRDWECSRLAEHDKVEIQVDNEATSQDYIH